MGAEQMEGLIISRETIAGGNSIQRYREEHGYPPLALVVVDLIGASSQAADADKLRCAQWPYDIESGPGGGSHGRWKRPCIQTAHMTI
jgi:phosphopantetheine adenylyltransferase